MEEKPKKKWYKTKIGIFFIILFLPISFIVFLIGVFFKVHTVIWRQNWKTPYRLAVIFCLWLLLFISPAFGKNSEKIESSKNAVTPQATIVPTKQVTSIPLTTTIPTIALKPTATPVPTFTPVPTRVYISPTAIPATSAPVQQAQTNTGGSGFSCDCSLTCTEMTSCAQAQYQLNTCGCSARDGDRDGIACDSAPLHCQN